ncbi:hypothetical protein NESM_000675900 [Novymonas esmeraldas]|uniref:Uncharacterized protein n=1 Tax=Novymonas esmeraldas TaxID=1808958 RepID=A0AAW0EW02_9TRYP
MRRAASGGVLRLRHRSAVIASRGRSTTSSAASPVQHDRVSLRCPARLASTTAAPLCSLRHVAASPAHISTLGAARRYSAHGHEAVHHSDSDDYTDDYLQAYEELLLNAVSGGDDVADCSAQAGGADADTVSAGVDGALSGESTTDAMVADALAVLPSDGSAVLLADLARSLDVEAVSELFGSVRAFVELYPTIFTCTQHPGSGRWQVSRSHASPAPTATPADAGAGGSGGDDDSKRGSLAKLDVAAMLLDEDLHHIRGRRQVRAAGECSSSSGGGGDADEAAGRRRSRLQPVSPSPVLAPPPPSSDGAGDTTRLPADAPSSSLSSSWWSTVAGLLPADGSHVSIAALRASLPEALQQELHTNRTGLARRFKQEYAIASRAVALTADATALCRATATVAPSCFSASRAAAAAVPLWSPPVPRAASAADDGVYVPPPSDYDASEDAPPWLVQLALEDDGDDAATADLADAGQSATDAEAAPAAVLETSTGLQDVPYAGLGGRGRAGAARSSAVGLHPCELNLERIRQAPAPPPEHVKALASADAAPRVRPPRPSTPAEWMALHTAIAESRRLLTPLQMLDYLVECVPTFFVPVEELRPSDVLLKIIGAKTSMRTLVLRVYVYFVERSKDKTLVRLAPGLEHPQRGAADVHYAMWSTTTTTATAAAAVEGKDEAQQQQHIAETPSHAVTAVAASSPSHARSSRGGAVLTPSAATRVFPLMRVLRPITSKLVARPFMATTAALPTPSSSSSAVAAARSAAAPSSTPTRCAPAAPATTSALLSAVQVNTIGYPFAILAAHPVETWPWWARLLCVLPFDRYVPLEDLGAPHYCNGITDDLIQLAWRSTAASLPESVAAEPAGQPATPMPLALLRAPMERRHVRLRPFWLAPGCTAELETSAVPAGLVDKLRPAWLPVSRVLSRLTREAREAITNAALRRPSAAGCSAEEAVVQLLRDCGAVCWVSDDGVRVRRFTSAAGMDDYFHYSISLLYAFSSARAWEPLSEVLARAGDHVQPLFLQQHPTARASPESVGLVGMLHQAPPATLHTYLGLHTQWLETKPAPTSSDASTTATLLVRRRASLVSF